RGRRARPPDITRAGRRGRYMNALGGRPSRLVMGSSFSSFSMKMCDCTAVQTLLVSQYRPIAMGKLKKYAPTIGKNGNRYIMIFIDWFIDSVMDSAMDEKSWGLSPAAPEPAPEPALAGVPGVPS